MAASESNVVVVGAGVIGCAVAVELARGGAQVTLVDRALPGGAASGASAGMLGVGVEAHGPGPMLELLRWSRELYPAFVVELENVTGLTVGHRRNGILQVALDDAELEALELQAGWQALAGRVARLSSESVAKLEPQLAPVVGAAWHLDDQLVDPRRLVAALVRRAQMLGVRFMTGEVEGLRSSSDWSVDGVDVDGQPLLGQVVVCGGSWSSSLLGVPEVVFPVRGQMLAFEPQPNVTPDAKRPPLIGRPVFGAGGYLVPRGDVILCGSTDERVGFDSGVTDDGLAALEVRARALCPALGRVVTRTSWAGLRPGSLDGLPFIGRVRPGLWAATGHYRNGIVLAPATAALLGSLLLGGTPGRDPAPFSFARLGI